MVCNSAARVSQRRRDGASVHITDKGDISNTQHNKRICKQTHNTQTTLRTQHATASACKFTQATFEFGTRLKIFAKLVCHTCYNAVVWHTLCFAVARDGANLTFKFKQCIHRTSAINRNRMFMEIDASRLMQHVVAVSQATTSTKVNFLAGDPNDQCRWLNILDILNFKYLNLPPICYITTRFAACQRFTTSCTSCWLVLVPCVDRHRCFCVRACCAVVPFSMNPACVGAMQQDLHLP